MVPSTVALHLICIKVITSPAQVLVKGIHLLDVAEEKVRGTIAVSTMGQDMGAATSLIQVEAGVDR